VSNPESERPQIPLELPTALAEFLKDQDTACLTQATDLGTAIIAKLHTEDIESIRGIIPIIMSQQLYPHPLAPVLRLMFTFLDHPDAPLTLDTYLNIDDPEQLGNAVALASQESLPMFFYDEKLAHTLTKVMPYSGQEDLENYLELAQELYLRIPREQYDFDAAKAAMAALLDKRR
jgi:hypothetical protein